ncbi:hypothetical protein TARUN_4675 [Trichoderma arundinaceum]|uniref:Uncharacterized protein n=1 Tax=Trichoderma arundinaceum TaxID=490622 RepID=A0A395NNI5_TRIAR|nr:hypothetical protein TARUN_4675 [Trichoderma arundinaceum]
MASDIDRFFQPSLKKNQRVLLPYVACAPPGPNLLRKFYEEDEREFVDKELAEIYRDQPPWIYPRTVWPTSLKTGYPPSDASGDQLIALYADVRRFPDIPETDWPSHVKQVHAFLVDSGKEERAASDNLQAMLRIVVRGIDHIVAIGHYHLTAPEGRTRRSGEVPQDGLHYGLSPGPEIFKTLTKNKRLFANFIFFEAHWAAIIWDRRFGQLYYFDSAEEQRIERATRAVRLWRSLLRAAGYADSFDLCIVPCTAQPGIDECGYLALFWLMATLRGLVGQQIGSANLNRRHGMGTPAAYPEQQPPMRETFDLRLRDWCFYRSDKESIKAHVANVFATLESLASNELGIWSYSRPSQQRKYDHSWNLSSLQRALDREQGWRENVMRSDIYTWVGGWTPTDYLMGAAILPPDRARVFPPKEGDDQLVYTLPEFRLNPLVPYTPATRNSSRQNTPSQSQRPSPRPVTLLQEAPVIVLPSGNEEDKYSWLIAGSSEYEETRDGANVEKSIQNVKPCSDAYEGSIDYQNLEKLGEAGYAMTVGFSGKLGTRHAKSVFYTLPSKSYCSLVPAGLMDENAWEDIHEAVTGSCKEPVIRSTRDGRRAAREAVRGKRKRRAASDISSKWRLNDSAG